MVVDLVGERTDGPELSLKLYHARKLPLSYQQLMTEAPQLGRIWTEGGRPGIG
jgi:hypothetical protein